MAESAGFMCQTYYSTFMMICENVLEILVDIVLVGLLDASWDLMLVSI